MAFFRPDAFADRAGSLARGRSGRALARNPASTGAFLAPYASLARRARGDRGAAKTILGRSLTILSCTMAVGSSRRNGIDWDLILSCDVLGVYKPDPRCYSRAAEILDCVPDEIMMVAAHPSDLRAAIACGYRSAYVVPIRGDTLHYGVDMLVRGLMPFLSISGPDPLYISNARVFRRLSKKWAFRGCSK